MALNILPKRFHPDFSKPRVAPNGPVTTDINKNTRVFLPTFGGFLEVNNGKIHPYTAVTFKHDLGGGVTGRVSTSTVTLIPTGDLNTSSGALLFRLKRDSLANANYLFDSDGARHLMFFNSDSGGLLEYFTQTVSRLSVATSVLPPLGEYINLAVTYPESEVWVNGKLVATGTSGTLGSIGTNYHIGNRFSDNESLLGSIAMFAIIPPELKGEIRSLTIDPYQLLKPLTPPVYFTVGATPSGRIMSSLASFGGLAGLGGIAGRGGGLAG